MSPKKRKISDNDLNRALKIAAIVLLSLLSIFVAAQFSSFWLTILRAIRTVFIPLILAFIMAYILNPIVIKFENLGLRPRWLSALVVFASLGSILIFAIIQLSPILANEINSLFENEIQDLIVYVETDLRDDFILGTDVYDYIYDFITEGEEFSNSLQNLAVGYIGDLPNKILSMIAILVVLPVMLVTYMKDYDKINKSLFKALPEEYRRDSRIIITRLNNTIGFYIRGQLLLMLAIGIAATIFYKVIGLDLAILFGLMIGLTNIIPYFGSIIGALPAVVYSFYDPTVSVWAVLTVNIIIQQLEGNIFQPIIMGKQLNLNPIVIIISILFFGSLLGPVGIIVATPLAGTIKVFIEFYQEKRQERLAELETDV